MEEEVNQIIEAGILEIEMNFIDFEFQLEDNLKKLTNE